MLDGAQGADTMVGGAGDDSYLVDNAGDAVTEVTDEGIDTVYTSLNYTLPTNVENVIATGSAVLSLTGNALDNLLVGNSANNILNGISGADTMIGAAGNDTYMVNDSNDVVTENPGEGADLVQSTITYTLGANFENLTLTGATDINGTGNSTNNVITGNSGNNILDGGTGIDTLIGGSGNDTYVVNHAGDTLTENAAGGTDLVQSSATYTLGAEFENLTLTGTSTINGTGNTLNNVLTGNSANNVLNGISGDDTMIGGDGDDTYFVNGSTDVVTENANEGTDLVQSTATHSLSANVENLTLTGTGTIHATGNSLNNVLTGNSGNNILNGGAGADTMIGGLGDDTYVVGSTLDVVTENASEGTDLVQSGVTYTLGANVENLTLTGTTAINGTGNTLDNVITGNSTNNILNGGSGGTDMLIGGAGNDTYVVGATDVVTENASEGTDLVQSSVTYTLGANVENLTLTGTTAINGTGNTLDNVLTGNSANNTLVGGAGNDTLNGGSGGTDTLIGGAGNDTYVVGATDVVTEIASEGTDLVQSSVTYTLGANVENLTLTGTTAINGTGNTLNNVITGNSANNTLNGGGGGTDTLIGGAGNDAYVVGASDVVTENASEGTDLVQSSVTYTLGANVENLTLTGTTAINGTGNTLDNVITGNSANNILNGGSGGTDMLIGGAGNDTYVVGATDVVTENASEGTDLVQSSVTYTLGANVENLTLTGTTAINGTGNTLNNVITGNSANNILSGGSGGTDTLIGGAGNDTYVVGATDVVTENASEGTDLVQSSVTYTLGANVENLTLTGTTAINGTGNTLNNVITGNTANNTLNGGSGADTLDGGAGNDILYGGAGNDVFIISSTASSTGLPFDTIDGGADTDTVRFTSTVNGDTLRYTFNDVWPIGGIEVIEISDAVGNNTGTTTLTVDAVGADAALTIIGNDGQNEIWGGVFSDVVYGNGGSDYLVGYYGDDVLEGGEGNDVLEPWDGADTVRGGGGDDTISLRFATFQDDDYVDGGSGTDILDLAYLNDSELNLTAISDSALDNLEIIYVADKTLSLNYNDVLNSSADSTLRIWGASGSVVNIMDTGWSQGLDQTVDGITYSSYTKNAATLLLTSGGDVNFAV